MNNITFLHPHFFWLLLLIPIVFWFWYKNRNKEKVAIKVSNIEGFKQYKTQLEKWHPRLIILRLFAIAMLIFALARPQSVENHSKTKSTNGIDIVLATDVSSSMLSRDFKPNRLEALKEVAKQFVIERTEDRFGVVVYASEAYTKVPVTSDKSVVINAIDDIKYDGIIQDGTGIGVGLGTAINRLRDSQAKSKVVILMTDGDNNAGMIDPMMAAEIAKTHKIKVYTIGIGSSGMAESPIELLPDGTFRYEKVKVNINENLMKDIAKTTGGIYYRATNKNSLGQIYEEINKLEKTKIDEQKFVKRDELFRIFALTALLVLLVEYVLRKTLFKGIV